MKFNETPIDGAWLIEFQRIEDARGFFSRIWCKDRFEEHGLVADFVQWNSAHTRRRGTLRGLHWQAAPHGEVKLMGCTQGALFDVIVDLRPGSPTFKRWASFELTADDGRMLYVPEQVAHGYQTLADETRVIYPVSASYAPEAERGIRWDDPSFAIEWPHPRPAVISDKDRSWPDFEA